MLTLTQNQEYDYKIFIPIAEALAFIKIALVHRNLSPEKDNSMELSSSLINRCYDNSPGALGNLLADLNRKHRTHFQATKVIMVVEKILQRENQDPNTIFVIRLGNLHREPIIKELTNHFANGSFKEIALSQGDLPEVEQKIQEQFLIQ